MPKETLNHLYHVETRAFGRWCSSWIPCISHVFLDGFQGGLQSVVTSPPQGSVSPSWAGEAWEVAGKTSTTSDFRFVCSSLIARGYAEQSLNQNAGVTSADSIWSCWDPIIYEERNSEKLCLEYQYYSGPSSTCRNGEEMCFIAFSNILCTCMCIYIYICVCASRCCFSKKTPHHSHWINQV